MFAAPLPGMRKLLFTALTVACATAAVRVVEWAWRKIAHEQPPEQPLWARLLIGKPLKALIER